MNETLLWCSFSPHSCLLFTGLSFRRERKVASSLPTQTLYFLLRLAVFRKEEEKKWKETRMISRAKSVVSITKTKYAFSFPQKCVVRGARGFLSVYSTYLLLHFFHILHRRKQIVRRTKQHFIEVFQVNIALIWFLFLHLPTEQIFATLHSNSA